MVHIHKLQIDPVRNLEEPSLVERILVRRLLEEQRDDVQWRLREGNEIHANSCINQRK